VLEEAHRLSPTFGKELLKYMRRKLRPDVAWGIPAVLLEHCPEVVVSEPEKLEPRMIVEIVLSQTYTLQLLVVQPVHIRMGESRVS